MENNRDGYGFTNEAKAFVHKRANSSCEFPGDVCPRPNTGKINHITGVFEARLDFKDRRAISDPTMNAVMLCEPHEATHDAQERFQVESLLGERHHQQRRMFDTHRRRQR